MKRSKAPGNEKVGPDVKRPKINHDDFVRTNKTHLEKILFNYKFLLTKIDEKKLITPVEYRDYKGKSAADLLDLLVDKGEQTCASFLSLLREDQDLKNTFPRLSEQNWNQLDQPELKSQTGPSAACPTTLDPSRSGPSISGPSAAESIQGYILSVSGQKKKKEKFFETCLFDGEKYFSIFCFKLEDQKQFQDAEKHRSPVRLEDVKFQRKKNNNKADIFYNLCSSLHVLDSLPFTMDPTLDEMTEEISGNMVNLVVKMSRKVDEGTRTIKSKKRRKMVKWQVSDSTGTAHLTVWTPHKAAEGKWYRFTSVRVGSFAGEQTLQTTPGTTMTLVTTHMS